MAIGIPAMGQGAAAGSAGNKTLQGQLKDVDAKIASARTHNAELQARVAKMERQNADRQKQLQQRDQ
ncbi:MAG: hypothetical protein ACREPZ_05270, partial [Rhodanobacteraceae bacterium]